MKIKPLPEDVINKIAAGEIVERPSSVLKELIENSLDANSKKIQVFIEKGGKKLIKVKDDGVGISPEDMLNTVKRFSTSKIRSAEDLYALETYGFRGEALASISSVSKFRLVSRTIENPMGSELYIEGGNLSYFRETGCSLGTTVEVKDLFFNTPARQKFLKSEKTELIHILDVFSKYAFIHTDKTFVIYVDNKLLYNFYPSTLKDRLLKVIGEEFEKDLIEISYEGAIGSVKGYILTTNTHTKKKYVFINKRPVKNSLVQKAVKEFLTDNFFILFIDLPSYFVDFNVHPSKEEVKFVKESSVVNLIKSAFNESLNTFKKKTVSYTFGETKNNLLKQNSADYKPSKFEIVGQIEDTFLIAYFNGEVYFIDQHVAQERVFYELLFKEYLEKGEIPSQKLLNPVLLKLTPDEIQRLKILQDKLESFGYSFKINETQVFLTGIPYNMTQLSAESALRDILDTGNLNVSIQEICSQLACKMSVKAGDKLNKEKAYALIKHWLETDNPNLCPHGRPIYYKISVDEIKKKVGRN